MRWLGLVVFSGFIGAACGDSSSKNESGEGATDAGDDGAEGGCATDSIDGLVACVEQEQYLEHLMFVAEPRAPASPHWSAVQEYTREQLEAYGFTVEFRAYDTGVNVIATRPGTDLSDELVLVSAHYDSRGCGLDGCLDATECNAADDNATGVASALEVARVLGPVQTRRSLVIALWDEEEIGLVGATAYVDALPTTGEQVHLLLNYDSIGFMSTEPNSQTIPFGFDLVFPVEVAEVMDNENRADFIAVASDDSEISKQASARFDEVGTAQGLSSIPLVLIDGLAMSELASDLRRSDHTPFWDAGIPALFITDSTEFRNDHYHCGAGQDAIEDLNHTFATQVTQATVGAAAGALELVP